MEGLDHYILNIEHSTPWSKYI